MDYLGGASTALVNIPAAITSNGNLLERIIGVAVALAVLRLEVTRRTADLRQGGGRQAQRTYLQSCKACIRCHAPEVASLVACFAFAVGLRLYGSINQEVDAKTWAEIVRQWPFLLTADSLLALQAMLRVLVLVSAVLRAGPKPLSHETALIFCVATLGRTILATQSDVYMLDGPLGGRIPIACECVSVLLLAILGRRTCTKGFLACALTVAVAACIARRHRLSLAKDEFVDGLFMFAHINELIASFLYLFRSLLLDVKTVAAGKDGVALRFGHLVMLIQQGCAAYYFVQAFEAMPALVSNGYPFEILQLGGIAQLGVYACAAGLHLAESLEESQLEAEHWHDEDRVY